MLTLTVRDDADVIEVENPTNAAFDRRGNMWRSDTMLICQDTACTSWPHSNLVKQKLQLRHTCSGGLKEADVQLDPLCVAEPKNCTMVKSQEVSDTHKAKDAC